MEAGPGGPEFLHPQPGLGILHGALERMVRGRLFVHEVDLLPQQADGAGPVLGVQARHRHRVAGPPHGGLEEVLEHLQVQPLLVPEVVGEERQGAPGLVCDHPHAGTLEAVVGEAGQSGPEQGGAGGGGWVVHAGPMIATGSHQPPDRLAGPGPGPSGANLQR